MTPLDRAITSFKAVNRFLSAAKVERWPSDVCGTAPTLRYGRATLATAGPFVFRLVSFFLLQRYLIHFTPF